MSTAELITKIRTILITRLHTASEKAVILGRRREMGMRVPEVGSDLFVTGGVYNSTKDKVGILVHQVVDDLSSLIHLFTQTHNCWHR